jgi:hypothetical protein
MAEILVLRADLRETLERDAEQDARSISDIVNEAVERYVRERQRAKLDKEIAAFEAIHAELRQKYLGQWVAINNQRLVDHDPDRLVLYRRTRSKYGHTSVLLREVTEQPQEEVWFRTPGTGRIAP